VATTSGGAIKATNPNVTAGDRWWLGFGHGTSGADSNDRVRFGVDIKLGGAGRAFVSTGAGGAQVDSLQVMDDSTIADTETALLVRRNLGGTITLERISMGATDSGGAGFRLLRVPN
jgi:hypothetical protein